MSSILEALQRAEQERQAVGRWPGVDPVLSSVGPMPARVSASGQPPESRLVSAGLRLRGIVFVVLAVATATSLAWWWSGRSAQSGPPAATAAETPLLPAPAAEARPAARAATPDSTLATSGPAPEAALASPTQPAPPATQESPPAAAAPKLARPRSVPDAPTSAPLLDYGQLPASMQRDLGPLALTGLVYSSSPASRLLMLDGQVLKEGDLVRPGLSVLRITPDGAVLTWRDQRFALRLNTSP